MICHFCKETMNQTSGPDPVVVLFNREPHKIIEEECPKCGREYAIKFFPRLIIHQRQFGHA
jgi:hypothetical protein